MGFEDPELLRIRGTDLQILEYFKLQHHGQLARLTNWLVTYMQPPDDGLRESAIHRELALMDRCALFYTTNFDAFIERAFQLHGRPCKAVAVEAHMTPQEGCAEIVKFHGDFDNPDRMVLTESDYERRLAFTAAMDLRFWSDLLNRTVLFLGYSFRDPNVSYLFRQVNERFRDLPDSRTGRRAYIVLANPSEFERRLFQVRNIEVIPVGQNLTDEIAGLLKAIRG